MRKLLWIVIAFLFNNSAFSQISTNKVKQAYTIAFGITPNSKEIRKITKVIQLQTASLSEAVVYFNAYIFTNRETIQRDITRKAYFSVFSEHPTSQIIEDLYASTETKAKNFADFTREFKTYFKDDDMEPK